MLSAKIIIYKISGLLYRWIIILIIIASSLIVALIDIQSLTNVEGTRKNFALNRYEFIITK